MRKLSVPRANDGCVPVGPAGMLVELAEPAKKSTSPKMLRAYRARAPPTRVCCIEPLASDSMSERDTWKTISSLASGVGVGPGDPDGDGGGAGDGACAAPGSEDGAWTGASGAPPASWARAEVVALTTRATAGHAPRRRRRALLIRTRTYTRFARVLRRAARGTSSPARRSGCRRGAAPSPRPRPTW